MSTNHESIVEAAVAQDRRVIGSTYLKAVGKLAHEKRAADHGRYLDPLQALGLDCVRGNTDGERNHAKRCSWRRPLCRRQLDLASNMLLPRRANRGETA